MPTAFYKNHAGLRAPHQQNLRAPHPAAFRRAFYSSHATYACSTIEARSSNRTNDERIRSDTKSTAVPLNCDRYNDRPAGEEKTRGFRLRYWRVTQRKNVSAIETWNDQLQQKFRSRGHAGIAE